MHNQRQLSSPSTASWRDAGSVYYDPDGEDSTASQLNCNVHCFFLSSLLRRRQPQTTLEERKDTIANMAFRVDPATRRRLVPMLQIVDLESSAFPLLLLEWVEQMLHICRRQGYEFPWAFALRDQGAEVFMGPMEDPSFEVVVTQLNPQAAYQACLSRNEPTIAEAYLKGLIDIHGDFIKCLLCFQDLWSTRGNGLRIITTNVTRSPLSWFARTRPPPPSTKQERRRSHELHYDRWEAVLLLALENDFDLYSPGIYMYDEEDMEPAAQRKLAHAFEQLQLNKGDTLLDIGCGWGGMMRYAANKGCHVTGITLSPMQAQYVAGHMKMRYFKTATVLCEDFYAYKPMFNHNNNNGNSNASVVGSNSSNRGYESPMKPRQSSGSVSTTPSTPVVKASPHLSPPLFIHQQQPTPLQQQQQQQQQYQSPFRSSNTANNNGLETPSKTIGAASGPMLFDAISMMGVLEELGDDYDQILAKLTTFLKPGGRIYLDFAAECVGDNGEAPSLTASTRAFVRKHIMPGPLGRWIHLPKWLQAVDQSSLVVDALWDNRHNYYLWAQKCYRKLLAKHEDFLQQYQLQQQQQQSGKKQHTQGDTSDDMDNCTLVDSSQDLSVPAAAAAGGASCNECDDAEFQYRLMLAMFAGVAASMVKQDYQCTAYRMVLKLPEGQLLR
jgi:cyclopropane fatty-acyl-phospholipid synthase-like methyltransferase